MVVQHFGLVLEGRCIIISVDVSEENKIIITIPEGEKYIIKEDDGTIVIKLVNEE